MTTLRPQPHQGLYDDQLWARLSDTGRLHLQACGNCANTWFPPGPACPKCLGRHWRWRPVSGRGRLLSWVVFQRQYFTAMPTPYTVVAAELEEGPIIIADLDEDPATTLRLGLPLQLGYTAAHTKQGQELTLYHWTVAPDNQSGTAPTEHPKPTRPAVDAPAQ